MEKTRQMAATGKLYLIPAPLGDGATEAIPAYALEVLFRLDYLVVEKGKTTRQFMKAVHFPRPLSEVEYRELSEHTTLKEYGEYLIPAEHGRDIGLLSEAGCPGVADPGAVLVELAHQKGIEVVPLVGPSSILLALMASGLNGQRFCFQGYLTAKRGELGRDLKQLEQQSAREDSTQIFIETPYRNQSLLEAILKTLSPQTRLCMAADLTLPTQYIRMATIAEWRSQPLPSLDKRPTVFLLHAR